MDIDRNGLEVLSRPQCLALLAGASLGRVGVTVDALPVVLPVGFCLADDRILIRTSPGTKLAAALRGSVVAFEADDVDPLYHAGWSVLVTGIARTAGEGEVAPALDGARIPRWAPQGEDRVVAISTDVVTGRRLVAGRPPVIERTLHGARG
ncbi:pyridoxamine 5'-phosphate oxidase family protein [Iamia majanohamensis]|uniref:Pyridoxamine 5'-phosphate oxidase family protein n=1 Tax=Iamia majanohamensis TaxID=467976 RepID=A0AAF0BRF0_9ACTN|nr:pyridoxamine 5'-phosphate oxidase family protein [Iamia majanohamensis]WCO66546.1 pyridoxamine 5'-phosphate oxidase family protein [Iamia majanohamensis]